MTDMIDVVVGVVVKAHGVRGDVAVESHTDTPTRFAPGATLTLEGDGRRLRVRTSRRQGGRLVVSFDGVDSRNDAELLVKAVLLAAVPPAERPDDQAEFYDRHLIGLAAELADGTAVGRVVDVLHGGVQDILAIATQTGERLVPFVEALVPQVDLAAGRLVIADLPGLLSDDRALGKR